MRPTRHDRAAEGDPTLEIDRSIPFIDAHHHVWELDRFPYPWLRGSCRDDLLGDYRAICVDWGPERLYRQFYGQHVIKSVHVEADSGAPDPVDETAWLESVAQVGGHPHALVVMCDIRLPGAERELVRHLEASPRVRGVRIRDHPDDADDAAFRTGYRALGRHGLSYELNVSPGVLGRAAALARAVPDVRMIVGHAGFPVRRDPDYAALWRREMAALASSDHVSCKVSGFATVDHRWSVESLRPWVLTCIELFGTDRVMFGTDWPVASLFSTYLEQVDAWRRIIAEAGFSRHEQEQLLFRNAERIYRI
jgi:predicted TIM-barrel fold metal-dependent hydrolase